MRITWRALQLGALVATGLMVSSGAQAATSVPSVHVRAVVKDGTVRLDAQANGPFDYTTYRPSESLYVLDLSGVTAAEPAGARVVASDLVKGYRVVSYASGERPVVRLEVLLSRGVEPRIERQGSQDLMLVVSPTELASSAARNPAAASAGASHAAEIPGMDARNAGSSAIRRVSLSESRGATEVVISGTGSLNYRTLTLHSPERVVLDFDGAHLVAAQKQIPSNLDPVRQIRVAQFTPQVSRVVIDLRSSATYNIRRDATSVTVAFGAKGSAAPSEPTTAVAPSEPTATAKVPVPEAALPADLTQPAAALATPLSAEPHRQETTAGAGVAAAATTLASSAAEAARPAEVPTQQAAPAAPPATATPAPSSQASGRYTGEPISVNLKDVDLRDFFRLIHEISGLNVVVDPAVKGSLTIVLDDVPWDQALDIVLKNNDLDKQLDGNVLRVATKETLRKEADENRDLAKAQAEAADVVTTTRVLSYAKSADMANTLKKFLSSRGDILSDDRSNTLIIRDIPSTMPVMDNLLRQLDRKSQQVEIEARVVAANRSFARELGTSLAAALATGHSVLGGSQAVGTSPVIHLPAPPFCIGGQCTSTSPTTPTSGSMPLITNLGVGSPTSGFSYIFQNGDFALDEILTAAENRGVGKLLSKPKIITQNNEQATVKQGTKIPVQTIVNNTVSVQFVDAVLSLSVTPQITADGTIFMGVTVQNDQIDEAIPRVEGIPAIDTQSAETKVTVVDGATVVIGGVIVTQQRTSIDQVPIIGSLPAIGPLFRHKSVSSTSQELLFFLTPRIIPS